MKYFDEIFDPFYKFDFCMNIVFNKKKKRKCLENNHWIEQFININNHHLI